MARNIDVAVKLYSGDKPLGLFVSKLSGNIEMMNLKFEEISMVFANAGVPDFDKLPDDKESKGKFAKLFKELTAYLDAATIQGFKWSQNEYVFENNGQKQVIKMKFDEQMYLIFALRYKELFSEISGGSGGCDGDVPYDLEGYLSEIKTGMIDSNYMNSRFDKYLKALDTSDEKAKEKALNVLHKTFATLTQEEQRYASIFLRDVQRGAAIIDGTKTLRDYITEYQVDEKECKLKE
jgi:type I restriction enzyme R subunit